MRFHSLALTGVGPFRGPQSIDFDAVSASGLFLIEGPTGSGKTTIIDAIVFALYGSLSGAESDASRMRSHLCAPDEPTEVVLDFSVAGVRHTITRSPRYDRAKSRGSGVTTQAAAQTLVVHDDVTPPMREAKEIASYLLSRVGLTADQFRRLVVLPQGEFGALLRAKPRERYQTLAGLIDDGYLERVQDDLKQRADDAQKARAKVDAAVTLVLDVMRERAAEVIDIGEEFDPAAAVTEVAERCAAATTRVHEMAGPLETVRRAAQEAEQRWHAARAAAEARAALERAAQRLSSDDRDLDDAALRARAADLIGQRARLEPLAAWEARADERARESARLHAAAHALTERLAQQRADAAALPRQRQALEAQIAEARLVHARLPALAEEESRLAVLEGLIAEHDALAAEADRASDDRRARANALQASRDHLHAARTSHHALVRAQLDQRVALLATHLQAGEPCPVCGSVDHPHPASGEHAALVTDDDVAAADALVAAAESAEAEAAAASKAADAASADLEKRLVSVSARLDGATPADIAALLATAIEARAQAEQVAAALPDMEARLQALNVRESDMAAAIEALVVEETAARTSAVAFDEQVAAETARHREQVGAALSAADLLTALQARLGAIEAVQAARESAAGQPIDADPTAAEAAAQVALAARREAETAYAAAEHERVRLSEAQQALTSLRHDLTKARAESADLMGATEAVIRLGALVTARSPANLRNLTLQAYAVQRRFQAVLEAASTHLERMSSGQYAFVLDESATGHAQAGLGIDIVDAWTGQSRDPATLSGGETFYASLSLALGLADVVREEAGGVTLETLFVDEGFGSLDADTLTVVLDQLDALRARGRTVGVISHVAEMQDWVHDRIEVVPSGRPGQGSAIRQTGT